jgi:Cu/Ag efflux protein CusF
MRESLPMKNTVLPLLAALLLSLAGPVAGQAQTATEPTASSAAQDATRTAGEVKRIDLEAGKVTIKHGEIKNLEMPPMTMVFVAKDRSQLTNLKAGDKVNFLVLNEAGKFIAVDIQAAQ